MSRRGGKETENAYGIDRTILKTKYTPEIGHTIVTERKDQH